MKAFLKMTPANAAAAGEFGAWRGVRRVEEHGFQNIDSPAAAHWDVTRPDPQRPPGKVGGRVQWGIPPSCAGSDWRGRLRSCAGPSPSSAAWARNEECCACDS